MLDRLTSIVAPPSSPVFVATDAEWRATEAYFGRVVPAAAMHEAALAALSDIFAVVVGSESDIP